MMFINNCLLIDNDDKRLSKKTSECLWDLTGYNGPSEYISSIIARVRIDIGCVEVESGKVVEGIR